MAGKKGNLSTVAAALIRDAFDEHTASFQRITRRAATRFAKQDWAGRQKDGVERLDLYEKMLDKTARVLHREFGNKLRARRLWITAKGEFAQLISGRHDIDRAETFYNSVTRKVLMTVGIDRELEFFSLERPTFHEPAVTPIVTRYRGRATARQTIAEILTDCRVKAPFENLDRDAELVAREIDLYLWPIIGHNADYTIDVLRPLFYRNKVAYLIGRIKTDARIIPMILPLYNGPAGVYVDAVLLHEAEASIVFSFAYSYFHVEMDRQDVVIAFLRSILPRKPIADLYVSLGYSKHGKTEFYRDLHHFIHESKEKFIIAPGKEGAVMIVFTLPDYNYVFKIIKDTPQFLRSHDITPKRISHEEVRRQYDFVCHRDRVGRMVDTQEFENLRFRRKRFSAELLREFRLAARENVIIDDTYVVINHLYVQRRVTPLPIYFMQEKDPEVLRKVIIDFGFFLKDMAATGIFPSDLFNTWNYGVTRRGRVVLYDYDDVMPLEDIRFREKPLPRNDVEELELEEDWIIASDDDFFMDEMDRYSGVPYPLRGIFASAHRDLFDIAYWHEMQKRVAGGEVVDIIPYDRSRQFRNGLRNL